MNFKHIAAFVCALALLSTLSTAPSSLSAAQTAPAATAYVLRVYLNTPQDVTALTSGHWDVLEARGKDYLLVQGDDTTITELRAAGYTVQIDHVLNTSTAQSPFSSAYYGGYRTVAEHYQHMNDVATLHPTLAVTVTYGVSWRRSVSATQGYALQAICITHQRPGDCALSPNSDKPRFFMMAAIHARELTTAELAWRWIDYLVNNDSVDPNVTALLEYNELWVVPLANPDGRVIVEAGGNSPYMQRKNANNTAGSCSNPPSTWNQYGVDLNRNASFKWGVAGTSSDPCDQTYLGTSQASEPEEQALESLMTNLFPAQRGPLDTDAAPITSTGIMLTLHSYANLVLLPWGWTECYGSACSAGLRAPNDTALRALAFHMSYYNGFYTGQASEALYATGGTTDDWAYGKLGIPGFTFEVGSNNFNETCSDFDPPYACQDSLFWPQNVGAFVYMAQVARQPYALGLGPVTQMPTSTLLAPISSTIPFTAVIQGNLYGNSGIDRPSAKTIQAAEFSIDTPPWISGNVPISMSAQDGSFGSTTEIVSASLQTSSLCRGPHTLYVQGRDSAGNWGPIAARWVNIPFPPGNYYCVTAVANQLSHFGKAGEVITYTLRVTNRGNVTDTLQLAASGNWTSAPATSLIGPLAPQAYADVNITVTIPLSAVAESDEETLVITSLGDNTASTEVNFHTSVPHYYYLPVIHHN
jgi:hypothetical protein